MNLDEWASVWNVPACALEDLRARMGMEGRQATRHPKEPDQYASESRVQALVRLEAAQKGVYLYRNNVGALLNSEGRPVRFGLANESKEENQAIKSSDLIGWRPLRVGPQHVGRTIAQFTCREVKEGGWVYTNQERERLQKVWLDLVNSCGGDAAFAAGVGTL